MWPTVRLPGTDVSTSSYHLLHVVGWFTFYFVGSGLTRSRPNLRRHWIWLALALGLCDTVGARFAYRLVRGWHEAGFFGTPILFAAVTGAYVVGRKVRAFPFLDAWAIAFSAAHVFEKAGCLGAGCCFGRPTTSALGVGLHSARDDLTRFQPLPLYEGSLHLLTALALAWLYAKGRCKGQLVMILGVVYGLWRSALEVMRAGPSSPFLGGPLSISQVLCVATIAFAATYLLLCRGEPVRAVAGDGAP